MQAIQYNTEATVKPLKLALMSDLHCEDYNNFDRETFNNHASACMKEGRYIMLGGDIFDAILPRDMKRYTPSRSETNRDDQINYRLEQAYELLKPYKEIIIFIGRGNHEESVIKYHSVDLISLLVKALNNPKTQAGNYQNWIRFNWIAKDKRSHAHYDILQHHGTGASAPITKGMIDFNRLLHGTTADLVWVGHRHNALISASDPYMTCSSNGEVVIKNRQAVMTPSYLRARSLDNNINFAEKMYTLQSQPGYAKLDLRYKNHSVIPSLSIITTPETVIGKLKDINIRSR